MSEGLSSARQREPHPSPRHRRWLGFPVAVVAVTLLAAACGGSSAAPSPASRGTLPAGWKMLTYGKVTISVPKSWTVFRGVVCPRNTGVNVLYLGAPNGACPFMVAQYIPINSVTLSLTSVPIAPSSGSCPPSVATNGLVTEVVAPCPTIVDAPVERWAPFVGVLIETRGPMTDQVLRTLHSA